MDLEHVHTRPWKFETVASPLRLDVPSTIIRHKNGILRKRSSNWRNLKTPAFHFRVHGLTHLKSESSRKQRPHKNDEILLARVVLKHKFKVNNDRYVSVEWTEKTDEL